MYVRRMGMVAIRTFLFVSLYLLMIVFILFYLAASPARHFWSSESYQGNESTQRVHGKESTEGFCFQIYWSFAFYVHNLRFPKGFSFPLSRTTGSNLFH
jgi:hypothetical protein